MPTPSTSAEVPARGLVLAWRRALPALLAAVASALACLVLPATLEERSRDSLTALAPQRDPLPGLLVVDISEHSLKALGPWPWKRAQLADLVEVLLGPLGARAVALDMVLPEPADAAGDARLASLAAHAPLVLAHVMDFEQRHVALRTGTPARVASAASAPAGVAASGYVANHAGLGGARCVGHIGVRPDADGVLRRVQLRVALDGRSYPTLGLALMECVDPAAAQRAEATLGAAGQAPGGWRIPFRRSVEAFATVSAEAVLQGAVKREQVAGRYVLVGSSAVGLSDYVATPASPVTAGVLVHGQVLGELMNPVATAPARAMLASAGLTLAALAALALALSRAMAAGLVTLGALVLAWLGLCAFAFAQGWNLRVLPTAAALLGFAGCWIALEFRQARRLSRQAMTTLSHYVAEPVLKLLVRQGLQRSLIPARQQITVLVADMASYTRLTASSSLEDSARLTTEFLEAITLPVLDSGGTLDRYTGDGLIAFWGAPLARADHAQCALDAAQAMLRALQRLNVQRAARGEAALSMRVGIESGEALVGDLGSSARSVYTAVGSCINLASRLQELARDIGETVVVGPQARAQMVTPLLPLGVHQPRGTPLELEVYGLPRAVAAR